MAAEERDDYRSSFCDPFDMNGPDFNPDLYLNQVLLLLPSDRCVCSDTTD